MIFYLDTSAWIAWKFKQAGSDIFKKIALDSDTVISCPLFVSEYVSFLKRNEILSQTRYEEELDFIRWIFPAVPLFKEYSQCGKLGFLRGADLYHIATALWFAQDRPSELIFLTCDLKQKEAAKKLGFKTP